MKEEIPLLFWENEDRMACCVICSKMANIDENLPGYQYRPEKSVDTYNCGCDSWGLLNEPQPCHIVKRTIIKCVGI
jgi:hypothetical protein